MGECAEARVDMGGGWDGKCRRIGYLTSDKERVIVKLCKNWLILNLTANDPKILKIQGYTGEIIEADNHRLIAIKCGENKAIDVDLNDYTIVEKEW